MNGFNKRWKIVDPDPQLSTQISRRLDISSIISQVLINRGLKTFSEIESFFNPRLASLSSPLDIPHVEAAVKRVIAAKDKKEKVLVYGDYDVDGLTATAIVVLALRKLGMEVDHYLPHRYREGYGLNQQAVEEIAQRGVKLIITVDCGISNFNEIELARQRGMEVIVTDHHNIPSKLPPAVAIVNPKLIKEAHPTKDLSGAGVAFKFIWALFRALGIDGDEQIKELLDLVALGTIADIVPLLKENRILTIFGLKSLNERKRLGLRSLAEVARLEGNIGSKRVNFILAPRLNASGRLEHAHLSLDLLLNQDKKKVEEIAKKLNQINVRRKSIGTKIQEEAFAKLDEKRFKENKIFVLSGDKWHPGVIGIVASRVVDKFCRPAVLIGTSDGIGRGSVRSIEGYNVYELLKDAEDLFLDWGGHAQAAGFKIKTKDIPELVERLEKKANAELSFEKLVPEISVDATVNASEISFALANELRSLEPYGQGNPAPLFLTRELKMLEVKSVGEGRHLKTRLTDGRSVFEAIGFGMGEFVSQISPEKSYDIIYNLEINEWNGIEFTRLNLVDLKESV